MIVARRKACYTRHASSCYNSAIVGLCRSARLDNPAVQSVTLSPEQSVEALLKTIANLKPEDTRQVLALCPMQY